MIKVIYFNKCKTIVYDLMIDLIISLELITVCDAGCTMLFAMMMMIMMMVI